jgi:hypothetical protein
VKFKGDIIITDPCYIISDDNDDDWGESSYGEDMGVLGLRTYLSRGTIYGDWSCTTFEDETENVLGEFCADAGMVAVFLLDEVLAYNPDFDCHLESPWTTTWIKDFDGEIEIDVMNSIEGEEVVVVGRGNVNFHTAQTGF